MIERIAHMYFTHAPERYGDEDDTPPASVVVDAAAQLFGKGPAASSMFGAKPLEAAGADGGINRQTARWTDGAAKAVAALKAEEDGGGAGIDDEDADPTAPVDTNA